MTTEFELSLVRYSRIVFVKISRIVLFFLLIIGWFLIVGPRRGKSYLASINASWEYWLLAIVLLMVVFALLLSVLMIVTRWFSNGTILFGENSLSIKSTNKELRIDLASIEEITFKDDVSLSEKGEREVTDHYGILSLQQKQSKKILKFHYIIPNDEIHQKFRTYIKYLRTRDVSVRILYR